VLLRCFVPQVLCYGLIALMTSLLNAQRVFAPPAWVPIANNLVCISVLVWFRSVLPEPTLGAATSHPGDLLLLGLGTTAGVLVQAALLVPFVLRLRLRHLWFRLDLKDAALRQVVRLGSWTFGLVVANQVALFVMLALAFGLGGTGQVSAYTYAWIFFQTPYAIVAISVMSAVTPELASRFSRGDWDGYRARFASGLRAALAIMIPTAVGMFVLARPAMELLLGRGAASTSMTNDAGAALAAFAIGLPGFTLFQFVVRSLQTMLRMRVAFVLYVIENAINVAIALACYQTLGVAGLALSVSAAYTVTGVGGVLVLRHWIGPFATASTWYPLVRVALASIVMGLFALVAVNLSASVTPAGLVLRLVVAVLAAAASYGVALAVIRHYEPRRG
jgi:putative peptidoglycan lipid II flippase